MSKRPRPWNAVYEQIYSISSVNTEGRINMNIATYVTPVTMKPKRYVIAVYRNTQTHTNIFGTHKNFLLQALAPQHRSLILPLGKKSGTTYDKEGYLNKKIPNLLHADSCAYIPDSFFVLALAPESYISLGDHDLVIARVTGTILSTQGDTGLTTDDLQKANLIL